MPFDRDAAPFVAAAAAPALAAGLLRRPRAAAVLALAPLAVAAFFRDPARGPDLGAVPDPHLVLAPADGKVMHAGPPMPEVAPPGDWQQVSIFLSLADVHINRTPVGGRLVGVDHRPGAYLAAFRAESAHRNERAELTVETDVDGAAKVVVFRQIVGVAARRVVTRVAAGEQLVAGQRIGLMRFGSRMDVFVPPDVALEVAVGDRTTAGESVLGRWPSTGTAGPSGAQR